MSLTIMHEKSRLSPERLEHLENFGITIRPDAFLLKPEPKRSKEPDEKKLKIQERTLAVLKVATKLDKFTNADLCRLTGCPLSTAKNVIAIMDRNKQLKRGDHSWGHARLMEYQVIKTVEVPYAK